MERGAWSMERGAWSVECGRRRAVGYKKDGVAYTGGMNEQLERQLVRQLKILNFWITTFGVLFLLVLGVIGFFLLQAVMFIRTTNDSIQHFTQQTGETLDIKKKTCSGSDAFSNFVKSTGACN